MSDEKKQSDKAFNTFIARLKMYTAIGLAGSIITALLTIIPWFAFPLWWALFPIISVGILVILSFVLLIGCTVTITILKLLWT